MKKSLMAVALIGAFAGVAQAQTSVQIYGNIDAGVTKQSGQTLSIGKRASNTLGFKGTEELGTGLKALFQLEIRYEPDTGTNETGRGPGGVAVQRPLFQGQSRVGLQGDFGMVRIGRGLTPYQETIGAFEPFHSLPFQGGFYTDLAVAGYNSAPLDPQGYSNNRWSNAFWYNTPVVSGFQLNAAIATKETNGGSVQGRNATGTPAQYPVGAQATANPFSVSATYNNGPAAVMLGYERNAVETKVMSIGASFMATPELKLTALASRQDQENIVLTNPKTKAWVLGANYALGPGKVLAGYGQKDPDGQVKTKQMSLGYEYSLSKRTYLYVDASRKKAATSVNYYDLGVNHSF
ncbi:porin [Massilia sp. Dwa41.01b]|uniref:porin n=1 Tax=unclassified Massilia TaxID=2609279 RepID=UPI0016038DBF|nr:MULTISPECIES: porin [unclassified Massilia]QNA90758.1 porin [Massilia sp. Dwa41.01b]QNA97996.1 porin [Massilia sp. Se16.2.3]